MEMVEIDDQKVCLTHALTMSPPWYFTPNETCCLWQDSVMDSWNPIDHIVLLLTTKLNLVIN